MFGIVRRYLSALGGCFDFRRLCAYVTHPLPLSRGETSAIQLREVFSVQFQRLFFDFRRLCTDVTQPPTSKSIHPKPRNRISK